MNLIIYRERWNASRFILWMNNTHITLVTSDIKLLESIGYKCILNTNHDYNQA